MNTNYKLTQGDLIVAYAMKTGLTPEEAAKMALEEDKT